MEGLGKSLSESLDEKKWFIYLTDHHEGPFSLSEMQRKLERGQISSASYVWAEGMADWALMQETPPFDHMVRQISSKPASKARDEEPSLVSITAPKREPTHEIRIDSDRAESLPRRRARWPWISLLFLLAIVAIGFVTILSSPELQENFSPILIPLSKQIPALSKWVSPIPYLTDVTPEDYEALKNAAMAPMSRAGATVTFALSLEDTAHPYFYVASNLQDGTAFDVTIHGVPDTLVGQPDLNLVVNAKIQKNIAKTPPLKLADGSPIPIGQYVVTVSESTDSPNKASSSKTLFLGGSKDAAYETQLKEYHEKLKQKAAQELTELKAFADDLEKHGNQTIANFSAAKSKHGSASKKKEAWQKFDTEWTAYDQSLNEKYKLWTPDALKTHFFYGTTLYAQAQQAAIALQKLHGLQNDFLAGKGDPKSLEIQVGEATGAAQSGVATLKSKIDQAEKLPPTANGMPQREGL